jgi:hypothetical protein
MVTAKTITQDCWGCPASWSGLLTDGRNWRARYRWGVLMFMVDADSAKMSVFSRAAPDILEEFTLGDEYDGSIDFEKVEEALAEHIDFGTVEWIERQD